MCSLGVSQVFCPTGPCPGPQAWKDRIKPLQRFTPFIPPPLKNLKRQKAECPIPSLSVQGVLDLDHTKQGSEHKTQVLFSSFCPPRQTNKETKTTQKKTKHLNAKITDTGMWWKRQLPADTDGTGSGSQHCQAPAVSLEGLGRWQEHSPSVRHEFMLH